MIETTGCHRSVGCVPQARRRAPWEHRIGADRFTFFDLANGAVSDRRSGGGTPARGMTGRGPYASSLKGEGGRELAIQTAGDRSDEADQHRKDGDDGDAGEEHRPVGSRQKSSVSQALRHDTSPLPRPTAGSSLAAPITSIRHRDDRQRRGICLACSWWVFGLCRWSRQRAQRFKERVHIFVIDEIAVA